MHSAFPHWKRTQKETFFLSLDQYQILKYYSTSESERNKFDWYQLRRYFQTPVDCPQSTAVSGTTPSGCTQRAPTGMASTRNGPPNPSDGQTTRNTHSRREEIPSNQLLDVGPAPNHSKKFYKASLTLLHGPVLSLLLGLKV